MQRLKAIILLDPVSRNRIQSESLRVAGVDCEIVTTLEELTDDLIARTSNLIFFEGFFEVQHSIASLLLYKKVYNLNLFYYGHFSFWVTAIQDVAVCMEGKLSEMTSVELEALLYKSHETPSTKEHKETYVESIAKAILEKETVGSSVHSLAIGFLNQKAELLSVVQQNQKLQELLLKQEALLGHLEMDNNRLTKGYLELVDKITAHNRELENYNILLSKSSYMKININQFQDRPAVLYFKQVEEFLELDAFLEVLVNTFNTKLDKTVKVLRLFDSESCSEYRILPSHYLKITNQFVMVDLQERDYIAKLGQYQAVVEALLENKVRVDVLIVVDAKMSNDAVLQGRLVQFNLCREREHAKAFGIDMAKTILNANVYKKDEAETVEVELLWDQTVASSLTGMSYQQKMNRLSSMTVVQRIVEEYRRNVDQF